MKILNENFIEKRDEIIRTKILAEVKKKKNKIQCEFGRLTVSVQFKMASLSSTNRPASSS